MCATKNGQGNGIQAVHKKKVVGGKHMAERVIKDSKNVSSLRDADADAAPGEAKYAKVVVVVVWWRR
jgi:hypothetical protein